MGEDAYYNGHRVKIGTCEDMYYLRADQRHKVRKDEHSVDVSRYERELRFRFPFPDEDNIAPGEFKDPDRGVRIDGIEATGSDHGTVQFTAHPGYLLNLPCPLGEKGAKLVKDAGLNLHKNGWSGALKIVQQKILENGVRCIVVACNACGAKWREETLEDALPYIRACELEAESVRRYGQADWWEKIAARIREGYEPELVVSRKP